MEGDTLTLAASLEHPEGLRQRLWWQLPAAWADAVTTWADPFVVGLVFPMMQWRRDVMVEGRVSPSLLANLETFMAIWQVWAPAKYQPVHIQAREEVEAPPPAEPGQTVVPFSCGVDSSFTVFRHRQGLMGRRNHHVTAGVVMNGFDIWLDQENAQGMYGGVLEAARIVLRSVDVACIPMTSNFHELPTIWADSLCTHLVSGLRLLAARFDATLIPNNRPYIRIALPWGSHPVSDPHLGSRHFAVSDDGGEKMRFQKVELISQWPEAMRHLRVCFENPSSHANCCRCEKCIRTILNFRIAGCPLPPAFARDVSDRDIRRVRFKHDDNLLQWAQAAGDARERGLGDTGWGRAILTALRRNRLRRKWRRFTRRFIPLRNRIRVLFRGSALNRRELAKHPAAAPQRPASRS